MYTTSSFLLLFDMEFRIFCLRFGVADYPDLECDVFVFCLNNFRTRPQMSMYRSVYFDDRFRCIALLSDVCVVAPGGHVLKTKRRVESRSKRAWRPQALYTGNFLCSLVGGCVTLFWCLLSCYVRSRFYCRGTEFLSTDAAFLGLQTTNSQHENLFCIYIV